MIKLPAFVTSRRCAALGVLASVFITNAGASAHDFWLEPSQFHAETVGEQAVSVRIGHPEDRSAWPLSPERLISVRAIGPTGLSDQQRYYSTNDRTLTFKPEEPGLHWFMIETQDAISELPADAFNSYLDEEHLTAIQAHRVFERETDMSGVERYSRRGKTLIAVGDWEETGTDHVTRPLGLTLEIIPLENPLRLASGEQLPLQVRYRGQPLSGAQIKVIRLDEKAETENHLTGDDGLVTVSRPSEGRWMYHVVWGTALPDFYDQDFDTIFSSLTFEIAE